MKTLSELKEKPTYRFLKVIYFLFLIPVGILIYLAYHDHDILLLEVAFVLIFILEIIKRTVYYIFLGNAFPEKN